MDQTPDPTVETSTQPPAAAPVDQKTSPSYGPILSVILIVAILVAGAFYVWNERLDKGAEMPDNGVRGEVLPEGSMPSVEGGADASVEESGPEAI